MLYALALEAIGDDVIYERRMCRRHGVPWVPRRAIDYAARPAWVARVVGLDGRGGLCREFLRGNRDYSKANSSGSRGIWVHYLLGDGLYEVNEPVKWRQCRRYFLRVAGGSAEEISLREVVACLS